MIKKTLNLILKLLSLILLVVACAHGLSWLSQENYPKHPIPSLFYVVIFSTQNIQEVTVLDGTNLTKQTCCVKVPLIDQTFVIDGLTHHYHIEEKSAHMVQAVVKTENDNYTVWSRYRVLDGLIIPINRRVFSVGHALQGALFVGLLCWLLPRLWRLMK